GDAGHHQSHLARTTKDRGRRKAHAWLTPLKGTLTAARCHVIYGTHMLERVLISSNTRAPSFAIFNAARARKSPLTSTHSPCDADHPWPRCPEMRRRRPPNPVDGARSDLTACGRA